MICGLVQQQQVGVGQRQFGQRQAPAFSARKRLNCRENFFPGEAVLSQVVARFSRQHGRGNRVYFLNQGQFRVQPFVRLGKIPNLQAGA